MDLTIIPGDGIGPEIMAAAIAVMKAVVAPFGHYEVVTGGEAALASHGDALPQPTLDSIARTKLALKGPLSTPSGGGYTSVNVRLRKHFDLYANVRPAKTLVPGGRFEGVDLILFRENVEGLYSGEGRWEEVDGHPHGRGVLTASNSRAGMLRFVDYSYRAALAMGRKRVTLVHKANIMKELSGIFLEVGLEVAERYKDRIATDTLIADDCGQKLVRWPEAFDVIVTTNLLGDILSDVAAGTVGGLGLAPGANMGDKACIFEAVHGSAPDIAGKGVANPSALILSAAMLLDHVGHGDKADSIRKAVADCIAAGERTRDIGGDLGTEDFTRALLARL
jgi:isocitrate dehydrogenase (NAD+)|nr:isocitrate/isopropylmalate family dehydrogenase [Neorhizobium tomejilense]